MTSAHEPAATAKSLDEALLRVLARQARRIPLPVFVVAVLIAALASERFPAWIWGGWLLVVACVLGARFVVLGRLPSMRRFSDAEKLRIAIVLSAVNGIVHGLSLGFFPLLPEFERAIQTMLLVGLGVGAIATTAGYLPVYLAYLIPTVFPLAVLWAVSPGVAAPGWIERSTAAVVALFGVIMIALAKDAFRVFRESFEIRTQQAALNRAARGGAGTGRSGKPGEDALPGRGESRLAAADPHAVAVRRRAGDVSARSTHARDFRAHERGAPRACLAVRRAARRFEARRRRRARQSRRRSRCRRSLRASTTSSARPRAPRA